MVSQYMRTPMADQYHDSDNDRSIPWQCQWWVNTITVPVVGQYHDNANEGTIAGQCQWWVCTIRIATVEQYHDSASVGSIPWQCQWWVNTMTISIEDLACWYHCAQMHYKIPRQCQWWVNTMTISIVDLACWYHCAQMHDKKSKSGAKCRLITHCRIYMSKAAVLVSIQNHVAMMCTTGMLICATVVLFHLSFFHTGQHHRYGTCLVTLFTHLVTLSLKGKGISLQVPCLWHHDWSLAVLISWYLMICFCCTTNLAVHFLKLHFFYLDM